MRELLVVREMSLQNEAGFSLIELLAAMVIMLVGLLGLLHAVNIAMEHNLKNQMRNEVTLVAQDAMNEMRSRPFDAVSAVAVKNVATKLRNINRNYVVTKLREDIAGSTNSAKYQVDVKWAFKNVSTTFSVATVRGRPE